MKRIIAAWLVMMMMGGMVGIAIGGHMRTQINRRDVR